MKDANYDKIEIYSAEMKARSYKKLTEKTKRMLLNQRWISLNNDLEFIQERFEII